MRWLSFGILSAYLMLTCRIAESAAAPELRMVPLTSVALVADVDTVYPDDPGTGGGFETAAYFQTRLADARAIKACMDPIENAAVDWANGLGLNRSLRDRTPSTLTLHYAKSGVSGFFAITYRVDQQIKARVRVDFIILDGAQTSPELARNLLQAYQIASLQTALDSALRCEGKAS